VEITARGNLRAIVTENYRLCEVRVKTRGKSPRQNMVTYFGYDQSPARPCIPAQDCSSDNAGG